MKRDHTQAATGLKRWMNMASAKMQSTVGIVKAQPHIVLIVLFILATMIGLGILGVEIAVKDSIKSARNDARNGLGQEASQAIHLSLLLTTFGSQTLAAYIQQHPRCSEIDAVFLPLAEDIFRRVSVWGGDSSRQ